MYEDSGTKTPLSSWFVVPTELDTVARIWPPAWGSSTTRKLAELVEVAQWRPEVGGSLKLAEGKKLNELCRFWRIWRAFVAKRSLSGGGGRAGPFRLEWAHKQ